MLKTHMEIEMKPLYILLSLCSICSCANILAILPTTVKSHWVVMEPLLVSLVSRGHHLTVTSNFGAKHSSENFTNIDCSDTMHTYVNNVDYNLIDLKMGNLFATGKHMLEFTLSDCETVFKSKKLRKIDLTKKYDLVITEMFSGNCFVHFAQKVKAPLVSIVTSVPQPWTVDYFGIPDNPAYIPNYFMNYHPVMTFLQRMTNTAVLLYMKTLFKWYADPRSQQISEDYFQEKLPWVEDVARQSSLLLVNSHFSLSQSRPLPPTMVEIGGIHIKDAKPLPNDLQEIMDKSTNGVILLSFGTMISVSTVPAEKLQAIMQVFKGIPQTVIMKYEAELPETPDNVVIRSWLPQRDILAHPNVVAVVTHGGLASVMEAVWSGVPLVGVPLFADQFLNINQVVWMNAGLLVQLDTLTEDSFRNAVVQVVDNPRYKENMRQLSHRFRDRPLQPLESAVYWVEYVIRHNGASHLKPYSTQLAMYQLLLLDVIAMLVAIISLVLVIVWWVAKRFSTMMCKRREQAKKKQQ